MRMKKAWLLLGSVLLFLLFALVRSISPSLAYLCLFGGILLLLVAISFLASPAQVQTARTRVIVSPPPEPIKPKLSIPLSAQKAHAVFSDEQFELFAAAVIIGGEHSGHTFVRHTGKKGDKGVDVLLQDLFRRRVCVQAKRYKLGNTVKSSQVREFSASIGRYRAYSGYIVTTSTLTRDGKDHINDENLRAAHQQGGKEMHLIDHQRLDELLRTYPTQIEKAWKDVLAKHAENSSQ
jgi:Restriction endonuclease